MGKIVKGLALGTNTSHVIDNRIILIKDMKDKSKFEVTLVGGNLHCNLLKSPQSAWGVPGSLNNISTVTFKKQSDKKE